MNHLPLVLITLPLQKYFVVFARTGIYFNKRCSHQIFFAMALRHLPLKNELVVGGFPPP